MTSIICWTAHRAREVRVRNSFSQVLDCENKRVKKKELLELILPPSISAQLTNTNTIFKNVRQSVRVPGSNIGPRAAQMNCVLDEEKLIINEYEYICVMFITIDSFNDYVEAFENPAELFQLQDFICASLDSLVAQYPNLFKIEHIGGDYVIASSIVSMSTASEKEKTAMRRKDNFAYRTETILDCLKMAFEAFRIAKEASAQPFFQKLRAHVPESGKAAHSVSEVRLRMAFMEVPAPLE